MADSIPQVRLYPCDRGMGGLGIGYHIFTASSNGVIFCKFCGKRKDSTNG